jgi:hypothetical protein
MSHRPHFGQEDVAMLLQPDKQDSIDSDEYVAQRRQKQDSASKPVAERSFTDIARQMTHGSAASRLLQPSLAQSLRQRREF